LPFSGILGSTVRKGSGALSEAAASTLRPGREGIYAGLSENIAEALERERGAPIAGGRGPQSGPFKAGAPGDAPAGELDGSLRGLVSRRYTVDQKIAGDLENIGQATLPFYELNRSSQAAKKFHTAIFDAKVALGDVGAAVDVYDTYAGKNMRLFLSPTGKSGLALKPDGDVVSVFRSGDDPGGLGPQMASLATQEGGRKLDAFDSVLPYVYNKAGYEDVTAAPFNREYAPEGWNYAKMGEPNVAGMVFRPGGPRAGYDPAKASIIPEYEDVIRSQGPEIWTPELTPGVSRQITDALNRPVGSGRTTVVKPERKMYPAIYKDPRQILDEGAAMVAEESPVMRELFGVGRQDLDDITREIQNSIDNFDVKTWHNPQGGGEHTNRIMNQGNVQRLQDTLGLAAADPRFAGSYGWYLTDPLRQKFVAELGGEAGNKAFDDFMQIGSVLSSGSAVPQELRRAGLANQMFQQGRLDEFIVGKGIPAGYGHAYHSTAHATPMQRFLDTGQFYTEQGAFSAPKTPNYYRSKTGENIRYPIPDAHFVRGIGLADVRPAAKDAGKSIGQSEAGPVRDWYTKRVADPLGMQGSPAQALMWNVLAPQTNVKTKVGAPFLELFSNAVANEAKATGQSLEGTLLNFIRGEGKLRSAAPLLPAGILGYGMTQEEDQSPLWQALRTY
jgi:hypothetical protein